MYTVRFDSEGTRDTAIADCLTTALYLIRRYDLQNPTISYQGSPIEAAVKIHF